MHNRLTPVQSSNIDGYVYLGGKYLVVAFKGGSCYRYDDVPQGVVEVFASAPSKGKYLNQEIKNVFDYELLSDDALEALLARFPEGTTRAQGAPKQRRRYSAQDIARVRARFPIVEVMF